MVKMVGFVATGCLAALLLLESAASAATREQPRLQRPVAEQKLMRLVQTADVAISEAEAASIAEGAVPGSRAIGVKLLSSGQYAVTLKGDGNVTRVMVDAQTGAVN